MFITLYGINNIGKTTQAKRLIRKLHECGKNAVYVKYPVYNSKPSGVFLDHVLRSGKMQDFFEEELQMWFTLNRYQFEPQLKELLKNDGWVVAEDYTGTGIAWGVAKGASLEWLENINKYLLKEDLAILIDGKRNMNAKEGNHIHERNDVLVTQCQKVFRTLSHRYNWKIVKIDHDWDITTECLWRCIEVLLK